MEGETSHLQGNGTTAYPPDPWTDNLQSTEPDFKWCPSTSAHVELPDILFSKLVLTYHPVPYGTLSNRPQLQQHQSLPSRLVEVRNGAAANSLLRRLPG